jgi:hypothetical protein
LIRDHYDNPVERQLYFRPKPGYWYFAVRCHFCESPIFIAEAQTQTAGQRLSPARHTYFRVVCVNVDCEKTDSYQPGDIVSFLWPGKVRATRKP